MDGSPNHKIKLNFSLHIFCKTNICFKSRHPLNIRLTLARVSLSDKAFTVFLILSPLFNLQSVQGLNPHSPALKSGTQLACCGINLRGMIYRSNWCPECPYSVFTFQIIVAVEKKEVPQLEKLYQRGLENGVKDLKILDSKEIKDVEPYCEVRIYL